jgi:uncharacterized protein YgiM (DUF1202 family)
MQKGSEALAFAFLVCCVGCAGVAAQVEASATAPITVEETAVIPTATATLTSSLTYAPTETATPTADWSATPTPIGTGTPGVVEVTPLGGVWLPPPLAGIFTPNGLTNVRSGPGKEYDRLRQLAGGRPVRVYAWLSWLPYEAWACLDAECGEWVALVYDGTELGRLELDE